ncbi:radical SAM protein [Sulfurovum sp. bin170]|uniref:radical SAM protein n=1 Tax=Sulfurovum sp. bin170 TaxID=2695268 RepID=UPI0013DFCB75|nr:radical SAM protein [Sulfurovum sp. bin170]NEW61281.1 radical SAM protein [Sulfurovum sp. bin170]
MNIIFGPINSRRFGKSLGIDLSPTKKQCNFDCLYCELDPAKTVAEYDEVVSVEDVMNALNVVLVEHQDIDALTITANGEPTLYPYLSELMDEINQIKGSIQTLILSNSAKIAEVKVQEALMKFDTVKLSLDCATSRCLKRLDRSHEGITVESIKEGMLEFRAKFSNPLIIEILMVKGINDSVKEIEALNEYLLQLNPTRIDLGTIDRPPAYKVEALSYEELREATLLFDSSLPIYIATRKKVTGKPSAYSKYEILETIKKRPLTQDDIAVLFDDDSKQRLKDMLNKNQLHLENSSGYGFFVINK